jgi:hypothetical protein
VATIKSGSVTVGTAGTRQRVTTTPTPVRGIRFESDDGNTGAIFIGDSTVSATAYGLRLASAGNNSDWIKFDGQTPGELADFYVDVATNGEKAQYLTILAL